MKNNFRDIERNSKRNAGVIADNYLKKSPSINFSLKIPLKICLLFIFSLLLFDGFTQNASVNYVNPLAQPDGQFTVCGNAERMTLRISNGNGGTMTGIITTLHIPVGGKYVAGSITGATESNIANLNSPQFSVADIPSANTKDISYQITFECPVIAFQNGGGLTKETVDLSYNGGTTQNGIAPSSTYNVVSASLSIISATNSAYSGHQNQSGPNRN